MKKTIDEIMQLSHCYKREQVEKLFAGREYLTLDDVEYLPIPNYDKVHILVELMNSEQWRLFARKCALRVIHLWDAPEVVVNYLNTGDETIRAAALAAAYNAACDAARAVTKAAAWSALQATACYSIRAAAGAAAKAAACDAALAAEYNCAQKAERIQQIKIAIGILEEKEKENDMGKN